MQRVLGIARPNNSSITSSLALPGPGNGLEDNENGLKLLEVA